MKLKYLLIIFLVLGIGIVGYFYFLPKIQPQSCDSGDRSKINILKNKSGSGYVACEIIVRFQDNITLDQASFIVKSMDLIVKEPTLFYYEQSKFLTIKTPAGKEEYYIAKLKELPQVKNAGLNSVGHID